MGELKFQCHIFYFFFDFCFVFLQVQFGFTSPVFHLDPAAQLGHILCRGLSSVRFFVSGCSRIQTHVLVHVSIKKIKKDM